MLVNDLIDELNALYPFEYSEKWDNVGLLVGANGNVVSNVLVCLDVNLDVVNYAINNGCNTIISHHPLIFTPLSNIIYDSANGKLLFKIIENNLNIISMHTNVDNYNASMSNWIANKLNYKVIEIVNPCTVKVKVMDSLENVVNNVKKQFGYEYLNYHGDLSKYVSYAYIIGGSGKFMFEEFILSDVDLLMTGDLNYHNYTDSYSNNKLIIDIMHFSEKVFVKNLLLDSKINYVEYDDYNCVKQM